LALKNKDITIYGDGSQTRTFCYIDDNLEATSLILKNGYFENEIINIGHDEEFTIIDLAKKVIEITNSKSEIINLPPLKEGDMTKRQPDISKMKEILKRDLLPLEKGIIKVIELGGWK